MIEDIMGGEMTRLAAWVDQELPRFTPWQSEGIATRKSLQRFAELAIAYDVLEDAALGIPALESAWKPFIADHLAAPGFGELARSRLDVAWALLLPYLLMRKHGIRDDYHEATLQQSRVAGFPESLEVVPYRALDYAYFAHTAGLAPTSDEALVRLLRKTFAAKASCRYLVNKSAAYAVTHAVFYASRFGRRSVSAALLPHATEIVDSMIIDSCIGEEYDLLGELLVCSTVLEGSRSAPRELGLSTFFGAIDEAGCLPPDGTDCDRSFDRCYHTTLVGLILCASLRQPRS